MGMVESVRTAPFFVDDLEFLDDLGEANNHDGQRPPQEDCGGFPPLYGASYPYNACLLKTHPVPTYTGP
jgi:hypothetical protein